MSAAEREGTRDTKELGGGEGIVEEAVAENLGVDLEEMGHGGA